jgi:sec-independent protein translocase protein TatA
LRLTVRDIGPTEIILILAVIILLFGAKKLPELARGSGRALRIFKAETKGLMDEDEETPAKPLESGQAKTEAPATPVETEQPKHVD